MADRTQLLQELDEAHRGFRAVAQDLDERTFATKWLDNSWGVREIAAHLTGWHGTLAKGLERMARGEKAVPEGEDWSEPQPFNEAFAEHAKGKQRDQVLQELDAAVEHLKEAARQLPEEKFEDGRTAATIVDAAGISHFKEHEAMVRDWREQQKV